MLGYHISKEDLKSMYKNIKTMKSVILVPLNLEILKKIISIMSIVIVKTVLQEAIMEKIVKIIFLNHMATNRISKNLNLVISNLLLTLMKI